MEADLQKSADETVQCLICMEYEPYLGCGKNLLLCSYVPRRESLLSISAVSTEDFPCETCRSLTAIGNFLSASGILSDEKPQITTCHACEKKKRKEKEKRKADMYYYVCNNVCCDNYGGSHYDIHQEHRVVKLSEYKIIRIAKIEERFVSVQKYHESPCNFRGNNGDFLIMRKPGPPPTRLRLIGKAQTSIECWAMCHHKGFTYIGQPKGIIDRIDHQGQITREFLRLDQSINSMVAYDGRLYCLLPFGKNKGLSKICVHGIVDGKLQRSWDHPRLIRAGQRMAINGVYLAVGDWPGRQIIIYSLTGEVIRRIPLPKSLTSRGFICMSNCRADSVVISDKEAGRVMRISLKNGDIVWSSDNITNSRGVVYHPDGYILVASGHGYDVKITVLDDKDGKLITVLTDSTARGRSPSLDLCLHGSTLFVPRNWDKSVLMYEVLVSKHFGK